APLQQRPHPGGREHPAAWDGSQPAELGGLERTRAVPLRPEPLLRSRRCPGEGGRAARLLAESSAHPRPRLSEGRRPEEVPRHLGGRQTPRAERPARRTQPPADPRPGGEETVGVRQTSNVKHHWESTLTFHV